MGPVNSGTCHKRLGPTSVGRGDISTLQSLHGQAYLHILTTLQVWLVLLKVGWALPKRARWWGTKSVACVSSAGLPSQLAANS